MSFLAHPDVTLSLFGLAVWCYVWSRGYFKRVRQRQWLKADAVAFCGALCANLAWVATGEPLFQGLLVVLMALCGASFVGRVIVGWLFVLGRERSGV